MFSFFRTWLRRLAQNCGIPPRSAAKRGRRPGFRPTLEFLENRVTPSTYFVDQANPSASDGGPGSAEQPFLTIGKAASLALAGDTVQVYSGTYNELVFVQNSGTTANPLVFTSAPGASVVVTGQSNGFKVSGRNWITIRGFTITDTVSYGIYLKDASNITIENNDVSFAGEPISGQSEVGIKVNNTTDSKFLGNILHHNSDSGMEVVNNSTGNEIIGNIAFNNARQFTRAAVGIDVRSANNFIANNIAHHNEDSGIQIYSNLNGTFPATNNLIVNNLTYANGDHGIDVLRSSGQRIIGNTVYNNVTSGINIEGGSTAATLANNLSVDNGINSPRTRGNIRVDANSLTGTSLDYDLVFIRPSAPGQTMITWGSTQYQSLAAFVAATGKETHGLQADPLWVNAGLGDFHVQMGSPAIDSADSGVSGQTATDLEGHPRVDNNAIANTGAGPRLFDDRGAFEFSAPPTTSGIANVVVDEDAANTVIDLFAAFADTEDSDAALTYTLQSNSNPGLFTATTIDGTAGTLTLDYAPNQNGTASLTVRATDTSTKFVETSFTVTVNAVNDAPTTSGLANVVVDQNAPDTVINVFAAFADLEDADAALTYTLEGNTNPGLFTATTIDGTAGTLTLDYAPNQNGTVTLTVRATDTGLLFVETSFTVTINAATNNPPTTSGIANVVVDEDAPDTVIDLFAAFADVEDADPALTYSISTNTNSGLFTATPIDGTAGTLTLDYFPNQNGTASLSVRATDTGGKFVQTSFTVTVNAVNDAPTTSGIANVLVNEDAADTVIDLFAAFADVEDAATALTYTMQNNTNPGLFTATTIDGTAGTLTLDYALNQNGTATLTVRATDTGGLFVETSFTVTVNAVNDTPTTSGLANVVVDQDAPDTVINLFAAFADVEDPDAALTYTVQNNTNPALFTAAPIDGTAGTLTLDYAPSQTGTATITVRASDTGGLFVDASFTVTVNVPTHFIYVDQSNPAAGDGSAGNPFKTISAAAAVAVAGDTVRVASGTYQEMVTVGASGTATQSLVFTAADGAAVTVTGKANGFKISGRSFVIIRGFTITNTTSYGINAVNSSNITLENNDVSFAGQPISGLTSKAIYLNATTNSRVSGNTVHHNTDSGIYLVSGSSGNEILKNIVHDNARGYTRAASGIDVRSGTNTIAGNIVHHNEDSGINIRNTETSLAALTNTLVVNNLSYSNGDRGITVYRSAGTRIISNTVYNNVAAGINAENTSTSTTIANNISVDNGISSPRTRGNLRVDATSISGTTLDYDLVFIRASAPAGQAMIVWGATNYTSLAAFVTATGMETHGLQADPLFVNPTTGDFHVQAGSPAIDSADSSVSGVLSTDAEGKARQDDPLTANTGAGPRLFDDRGAFEF